MRWLKKIEIFIIIQHSQVSYNIVLIWAELFQGRQGSLTLLLQVAGGPMGQADELT